MTLQQIRSNLAAPVKRRWFLLEGRSGGEGEWTAVPAEDFEFEADLAAIVSSLKVAISEADWVETCRAMDGANPLALGSEIRLKAGTTSSDAVYVFRGLVYASAVTTVEGVG